MDSRSPEMSSDRSRNEVRRPRIRWWPAVFFLVLVTGGIVWTRFFWGAHQQDKNVLTAMLVGVGFALLLLWLMVLSRMPPRWRWSIFGVLVLIHVLVIATVRIKGVDGNLVPVLEWRWKRIAERVSSSEMPVTAASEPAARRQVGVMPDGWPQFLGPNRNGILSGVRLETNWVEHPPQEMWRRAVGPAWSGFAVVKGLAVTQEQRGEREAVVCMSAVSGKPRWSYAYEARYATTIAGEGPRATPTLDGDRVFASGATGWLTCLELSTGKELWSHNVIQENEAEIPAWGYSVSPLVVGNLVIVSAGGGDGKSLVALDTTTGETVWSGGDDGASYSSPVCATLDGLSQVVVFNSSSVAGHDLQSGRVLWQRPYDPSHVHVAIPLLFSENRVLCSSGYGHGSELYSIRRTEEEHWHAELKWKSRRMKAKFANLVEHEGYTYGLDDGILACISAETGKLTWKDGRYGHGQVLLVGDQLLVMSEGGEVILVEASPQGLREFGRWRVFSGKTWNPPALAGDCLFLRTDQEAVCLRLPMR